ncbi:MAG TPA: basic secretory protein-like protein [Verrucomicrobiae bacterium]|nr:basic secretory protein-like protein [Verrucomicrobiae bacterium]
MTRRFPQYGIALLLFALAHLCGCATQRVVQFPDHNPEEPVRAVIFKGAPEITSLADRARKVGNDSYPKILKLLGEKESEAPKHFDIVFQNHASVKTLMSDSSGGYMKRGKIYLGLDWLTNSPEELDSYLVHEIAHVAQDYHWRKTPPHWTEGLADYVHFKLGYTNGWECAQCSAMCPHYTSGYGCAAAFLLFVEANYNAQIAVQLNQELRAGKYSDAFFKEATGKDLAGLWTAFQKTPAFKPSAADILKLEESLGYVDGKPTSKTKPDAQQKLARARSEAIIKEQPGGAVIVDAFRFLKSLRDNNQLPGWKKDEKGHIEILLNKAELFTLPKYPFRYTVIVRKNGDSFIYHYAVMRETADAAWKLEKSWRTGKNDQVIRDL